MLLCKINIIEREDKMNFNNWRSLKVFSSIGLSFLNPMLGLRHWDVTSFCSKETERIGNKIGERKCATLGWTQVKGERKRISLSVYTE